ncbi:hypothetical protein DL93DRAFT_2227867 [Clavulina sp. PMI_390]|nr:hypothetical protein DL93DRAFT_2227867 [Clavulina sp. PMI_390]
MAPLVSDRAFLWLIILTLLALFGFIASRWILPEIIRHFLTGFRVRSISARSIRGLYVERPGYSLNVDRIGISFHSPTDNSARHVHFQIQGLVMRLSESGSPPEPLPKASAKPPTPTSYAARIAPPLAIFIGYLPSKFLLALDLIFRPFLRSFFVSAVRLIIRLVPSLSQILDVELDTATFVFKDLGDAYLTISGVTVASKADFEQLSDEVARSKEEAKIAKELSEKKDKDPPPAEEWKSRLFKGSERVWKRAVSVTEGSTSVSLRLGSLSFTATPWAGIRPSHRRNLSTTSLISLEPPTPSSKSFKSRFEADDSLDSGVALSITQPSTFNFSLDFTHKSMKPESLKSVLEIPSLVVSRQSLNELLERAEDAKARKFKAKAAARRTPTIAAKIRRSVQLLRKPGDPTPSFVEMQAPKTNPMVETFVRLLHSIEVRFGTVSYTHDALLGEEWRELGYLECQLNGVFAKAKLTKPDDDELLRRFLGKPTAVQPKLDAPAFSFSLGVSSVNVQRPSSLSSKEESTVFALGESGVDVIATQIPGLLPSAPSLSSDPNASFVILETRVRHVRLAEHDRVVQNIRHALMKRTHIPGTLESRVMKAYRNIPRFVVDIRVDDIKLRLWHEEDDLPAAVPKFAVELATDHFGWTMSSSFGESTFTQRSGRTPNVQPALKMTYGGTGIISPTTLRLETYGDNGLVMSPSSTLGLEGLAPPNGFGTFSSSLSLSSVTTLINEGGYLAKLDTLEIALDGQALVKEEGMGAGFKKEDFVTEVKLRCESSIVDLRDLEASSLLQRLIDVLQLPIDVPSYSFRQPQSCELMSKLPSGLVIHGWFGGVQIAVCGKDINPHAPADLSRGVALSTSILVEFCNLSAPRHLPYEVRDRPKFSRLNASARNALRLPTSLVEQAVSMAFTLLEQGRQAAFWRVNVQDTKLWSLTSTSDRKADFPYLADDVSSAVGPRHHVDQRFFLLLPEVKLGGQITSSSKDSPECHDVFGGLSRIFFRFSHHHIYSSLLAVTRLAHLKPRSSNIPATQIKIPSPTKVTFRLSIADIQVTVHLLGADRLYLRMAAIAFSNIGGESHLRSNSLLAWVPSQQKGLKGKWEELGRITHVDLRVNVPPAVQSVSDITVNLHSKGFRLRLPYDYQFHELIQASSLTFKTLKHLAKGVSLGAHIPMGLPTAEDAKYLPTISFSTEFWLLEIADDPFESRFGAALRVGLDEQVRRIDRAEAFDAKVAAIRKEEAGEQLSPAPFSYHFDGHRVVESDQAWSRLMELESQIWIKQSQRARDERERREEAFLAPIKLANPRSAVEKWISIDIQPVDKSVPLFRLHSEHTEILITPPCFESDDGRAAFMADVGSGLPSSTAFSLLIPFHVCWSAKMLRVSIRDHPLPMFNIPINSDPHQRAWVFDTDLVVAEELGAPSTVFYVPTIITEAEDNLPTFSFLVPKMVMPTKTYAEPTIDVKSSTPAILTWGVSVMPGVADVARAFDRIAPPPQDPSAPLGFWDKFRLIFHWRLQSRFSSDVHVHLKGSRDPNILAGSGAGFVMEWKGQPTFTIGTSPKDMELLQLRGKEMRLAIPDLRRFDASFGLDGVLENPLLKQSAPTSGKILAKFMGNVRMGLGFVFEGDSPEADHDPKNGASSRVFTFKPHYQVAQRTPVNPDPTIDSYDGFRSQHVHLSVSLESSSSTNTEAVNSIHLSPDKSSHFWSWWGLFNHALSLPIRSGTLFPAAKAVSPKLSQSLATVKYRIDVAPLFISHIYHQDSRTGWQEGNTTCVGVKMQAQNFRADLHQQKVLNSKFDTKLGRLKQVYHKQFNAAEAVLTETEVRAVRARFSEPQKARFSGNTETEYNEPDAPVLPDDGQEPDDSDWRDMDDFVELSWTPGDPDPSLWLVPFAFVPRFNYLKHSANSDSWRFGHENTHICLHGQQLSMQAIQRQFAIDRLEELRKELTALSASESVESFKSRIAELRRAIAPLDEYVKQIDDAHSPHHKGGLLSYYMTVDDSAAIHHYHEFENVYQVHNPRIIWTETRRDILMDYVYSSRRVQGFEYQMSERLLQFMRDQAAKAEPHVAPTGKKTKLGVAGKAVRRILPKEPVHQEPEQAETELQIHDTADIMEKEDPLHGLAQGSVVKSGHYVLMLKPQVILSSEKGTGNDLVAVANMLALQNYSVMDPLHIQDPVNGVLMHRNHAQVHRMQVFSPSELHALTFDQSYNVPLEVLVDNRCEHGDFHRLLPHTDVKIHYDKFNRLRLRSEASMTIADGVADMSSHLKTHTDRVAVSIPRFSVSATAANYTAIYNVVQQLIMYSDPVQKQHNEALQKFIYLFDFKDKKASIEIVSKLQQRIRVLQNVLMHYDQHFSHLSDAEKDVAYSAKSQMFLMRRELNLIHESYTHAQAKAAMSAEENHVSALRVDAMFSELAWHMLDDLDGLMTKLAVRGGRYTWMSRDDGSMVNKVVIKDIQALDARHDALFPEIAVKLDLPGHKSEDFLVAKWETLPPVGGISIWESFNLKIHPIQVHIERQLGRKLEGYAFKGASEKRAKIEAPAPLEVPSAPFRPRGSLDASVPPTPRRLTAMTRASSYQDLKAAASTHQNEPSMRNKLKKTRSIEHLRIRRFDKEKVVGGFSTFVDQDLEEMNQRANQNRTFLSIQIEPIICLLTYKKDDEHSSIKSIPNLVNFKFQSEKIEYENKIWSFQDLVKVAKREMFHLLWNQKGALLETVMKSKLPSHRRHLHTPDYTTPSSSTVSLVESRKGKGRWNPFRRGSSHSSITTNSPSPAPTPPLDL